MNREDFFEDVFESVNEVVDLPEKFKTAPSVQLLVEHARINARKDQKRHAMSDLMTFYLASKSEVFNCRESDFENVSWRRFSTIMNYDIKSQNQYDAFKYRLIILSMSDHRHDMAMDHKGQKYNPFNADAKRAQLDMDFAVMMSSNVQSPEADAIITTEAAIVYGWWID